MSEKCEKASPYEWYSEDNWVLVKTRGEKVLRKDGE